MIESVFTVIGIIIGVVVAFWVQERQFKREEKQKKEVWKCYLETLKREIEVDYKRLCELRNEVYGGYPSDYFDPTVKRTILQEIIKTPLFVTHDKVFGKISALTQRYEMINNQSALVRVLISGQEAVGMSREVKLRNERDILFNLLGEAITSDIGEDNNKPALAGKLEQIQKSI